MSSFINFNNKEITTGANYSAEVIKIALLKSETKSSPKAEMLVKNVKEPVSLNEALVFFTDKLSAMKSLSNAIIEVNEGRVKQFEMDYASMVKEIKKGYGWIDPEYVADTWENSSDSIGFDLVRDEIFDRLIAAGLLAHANSNNPEKAGKYIKSAKDLYVMESEEVNETLFYAFFNNKKIEVEGKDLWDAKQKAIIELKVPKSKVGLLAVVSAESQKNQDFRFESVEVNESTQIFYLVKNNDTGKNEVRSGSKNINKSITGTHRFNSKEEAEDKAKELDESVVTEGKSAGLSKEETLKVAQKFADALAKVDGVKVTVSKGHEEDSFDLDYDGEEFAGGSYNIYKNGDVVNMAVPNYAVYGKMDDDIKTIIKNINKVSNESVVTEGKARVTKKDIEDIEDSGNIDIAYKKAIALLTSLMESTITEGKADYMARYKDTNINLKKAYNHLNDEELNQLYLEIGELIADNKLKVKDVAFTFESATNEAFYRMSSDTVGNELYAASQALTTYYDWLQAGNDSGEGKSLDHIIDLLKKCKNSIKKFNKAEEVKGTVYESSVTEASISGIEFGNDDDIHPTKHKPLTMSLKKNKVKMEVEKEKGDHGYPEVKLTGKRKDIEKVLADIWGPDIVSDYEDYFESVITEGTSTSLDEFTTDTKSYSGALAYSFKNHKKNFKENIKISNALGDKFKLRNRNEKGGIVMQRSHGSEFDTVWLSADKKEAQKVADWLKSEGAEIVLFGPKTRSFTGSKQEFIDRYL